MINIQFRNKYKQSLFSLDITPPNIECPENFTITLLPQQNFSILATLPGPNITDNSNLNVSFWAEPAISDSGIHLSLGVHNFTYHAMDAFNNKAFCYFYITVVDDNPPVFENCINPPDVVINLTNDNNTTGWVEWDDPVVYDNSNGNISLWQSLQPNYLGLGIYEVKYIATDAHNNSNSCVVNVTVKGE